MTRMKQRFIHALAVVLCAAAASPSLGAAGEAAVKLADKLVANVPGPWVMLPVKTRNMIEVKLPKAPAQPLTEQVRVAITTEARKDHAAAVRRLTDIAAEQGGQIQYLALCGWPALERRSIVELARTMAKDQLATSAPPGRTTVVTVAVAADEKVVRYEGTLAPDAPATAADEVVALAR